MWAAPVSLATSSRAWERIADSSDMLVRPAQFKSGAVAAAHNDAAASRSSVPPHTMPRHPVRIKINFANSA